MSWERKWKEFQTADRLDEAIGAGIEGGPRQPKQRKAAEDRASFRPSSATVKEAGLKPRLSKEQIESLYGTWTSILNSPRSEESTAFKKKYPKAITRMETLFGSRIVSSTASAPRWKPGDQPLESWGGVISYDKEEFSSPADAKKARGDERFSNLDASTAAKANDAFRAWLNKPENEDQMKAVVTALRSNSKTKKDPTIGKKGSANNHFKAAWQVAGAAFVDTAMSEDGLSKDVAAKLGGFNDAIGALRRKRSNLRKGR